MTDPDDDPASPTRSDGDRTGTPGPDAAPGGVPGGAAEPRAPACGDTVDPYSRVDYRRLIAWERRIAREGPWLSALLDRAPDRSVLDLGCGTGEHVAHLAAAGARAVGLDRSEAMIAAAREHESAGHGRFVLGDVADAPALLTGEPPFGLALCLGNVLPHVDDEALPRWLAAVHAVLAPGALLLVQLLNYRRILERGERVLPVNLRPAPARDDGQPAPSAAPHSAPGSAGEPSMRPPSADPHSAAPADDPRREIVFVRLMRDEGEGRMLFFPTTLELDPDAEEPVRVVSSRRVSLRAWTDAELLPRFAAAGLPAEPRGDMAGAPYDPLASTDLVLLARRAGR